MRKRNKHSKTGASEKTHFKLVAGLVLVGTVIIWLFVGVLFGGMGGHLFPTVSKLNFLENSNTHYFKTEEEMRADRDRYEKKILDLRKRETKSPEKETVSKYEDQKNGRVIRTDELGTSGVDANGDPVSTDGEEEDDEKVENDDDPEGKGKSEEDEEEEREDSDADIQRMQRLEELGKTRDTQAEATVEVPEEDSKTAMPSESQDKQVFTKPVTYAYDLALAFAPDSNCSDFPSAAGKTKIYFRQKSSAIKGQTLDQIDRLIEIFELCANTKIVVVANQKGLVDSLDNKSLRQRREDEIKYYLLHRRIPKKDIMLRENS